jgi:hypothetical protein
MNIYNEIKDPSTYKVKNISSDIARVFFKSNGLNHNVNGTCFGLWSINELVAVIITVKPRKIYEHDLEIVNYCTKKNILVPGYMKIFIDTFRSWNKTVMIKVDRRWYNGSEQEEARMKVINEIDPQYWYIRDHKILEDRKLYLKRNLSKFLEYYNDEFTERENMIINGYDRIWDCGSLVYSSKK